MNALTSIPYNLEMRDTISSALYRLEELRASSAEVVRLDCQLEAQEHTREGLSHDDLQAKLRHQTHIFDNLEAFLAAWARVSLLLFPSGRAAFTKHRGETLRGLFGLDDTCLLADRELRDAWMHHDERIDAAVEMGRTASGQLFTRAADITDQKRATFLRIVDVDNLVVHYHARDNQLRSVALAALEEALNDLEAGRVLAFDRLRIPGAAV
jgi:hypothetical protein